jgi:hypothetical protein
MKLWRTAENPSGDTVDFTDVLNNQKSFGHDCTAPP